MLKPNEHGVYDAEYIIPIKIGRHGKATIELCETEKGWLSAKNYHNPKTEGFGEPLVDENPTTLWQGAVKKAIAGLHIYFIGDEIEKTARKALNELSESLPVLRIEDFKTQEAKMAKKKPAADAVETTEVPTGEATPTTPAEDKYYLHKWSSNLSVPMAISKPLTDHGKKLVSDDIDHGLFFEIIDQATFDGLRLDQFKNLPQPSDEKHAEVCKLVDYEAPIKKEISCSEYFEHVFTSNEIKQMAAEFSEATSRKQDLEEELKSHAQYLKSQITEVTATINRISQELGRGKRSNSVKCKWILNTPTRGEKTLYRLDKEPKERVRVECMTASDKQLTLDDIAAAKQKTERTLEEKPITPVTNEPYEGEMLSDKEVEKEVGFTPDQPEEAEADAGEAETDPDDCPI